MSGFTIYSRPEKYQKLHIALLIVKYGKNKKKCITKIKMSTNPASKTFYQDSATSEYSVL